MILLQKLGKLLSLICLNDAPDSVYFQSLEDVCAKNQLFQTIYYSGNGKIKIYKFVFILYSMAYKQRPWVLADAMACSYCNYYRLAGLHAASEVCQNRESPYYDNSSPDGTDLTFEQHLRGCDLIDYNGRKIPALLCKIIPRDSSLRKYPLEQLVDGFADGMDLASEMTVEEMTRLYERQRDAFSAMLRRYGL